MLPGPLKHFSEIPIPDCSMQESVACKVLESRQRSRSSCAFLTHLMRLPRYSKPIAKMMSYIFHLRGQGGVQAVTLRESRRLIVLNVLCAVADAHESHGVSSSPIDEMKLIMTGISEDNDILLPISSPARCRPCDACTIVQ